MKMVFASTVGTGVVSKIDVLTPPIVPFRGDVEAEEVGEMEPPPPEVVESVEYGEVAFFESTPPVVVVANDEVVDAAVSPLYDPFCA